MRGREGGKREGRDKREREIDRRGRMSVRGITGYATILRIF